MVTAQDDRLAELVLQRRLLTPAQLSECRQAQRQSATPCSLAQVIVARRLATPDALRALIAAPGASGTGTGRFDGARVATARTSGAPNPADDPDVAFGRFLFGEGHVSADQVREAYKLLTGYREQHPTVNLSQVLAKHGMVDKEVLRASYQRFRGQQDGTPPSGAVRAPAPGNRRGTGEVSRRATEERFGFKTVELDPQERPDYPGPGQPATPPPPGAAFFSPFASPADQGPPPGVDPQALDDFLPVDSAAVEPANGSIQRGPDPAGSIQRGPDPAGSHPQAPLVQPPPGRAGPGDTRGETRGSASRRGAPDSSPGSHWPAGPVKLPPPLQLRADSEEDAPEDSDEGLRIDLGADASDEKGAGDTDIQSSTFGAAKRRQQQPQARGRGLPVPVLAAGAGGLVVAVSLGLWGLARHFEHRNARRDLLAAAGVEPAEATLRRREALPAAVLEDPEVAKALATAQAEVDRLSARAAAEAELARLATVRALDERLAICTAAVTADPTFAAAYVARARVKLALARRDALAATTAPGDALALIRPAMADVDEALARDPRSALAYLAKAQLYLVLQSDSDARQKAQSSLQNVLTQDPQGPVGALAQGLLEHLRREWDAAIVQFGRALQEDPKLVEAYLLRAEARMRKRDHAGALSDAAAAARLDPTSADALTLQAEARLFAVRDSAKRFGDRPGALADVKRALELDPSHGRALAVRAFARLERDRIGDLLSAQADIDLSRADALKAIRADPDQPLAHVTLAEIERKARNPGEALLNATHAVERGRHMPFVYLVRGRLRAREGDDQAIQDFDEVLRLEPQNAPALTNKAALLIRRNEYDDARAYLDQAIAADPELAEAYFNRGYIHLLARPRQFQPCIDDMSKAIELKAQFPEAYFYRACAFSHLNQWDQCLEDLRKAEEQRRDGDADLHMRDVFLLRGHCHYQKREWRECEAAYAEFQRLAQVGHAALAKVTRRLDQVRRVIAGEPFVPDNEKFDERGR